MLGGDGAFTVIGGCCRRRFAVIPDAAEFRWRRFREAKASWRATAASERWRGDNSGVTSGVFVVVVIGVGEVDSDGRKVALFTTHIHAAQILGRVTLVAVCSAGFGFLQCWWENE